MLDSIDFRQLSDQLRDVVSYSQNISSNVLNFDEIIEQWWANKRRFYALFRDSLIYEYNEPISISYDAEMQNAMFSQFISIALNYLDANEEVDDLRLWEDWMYENRDGFFTNTVNRPLEGTDMKKGMKLLKAFKFFDFSDETIRHLQDVASQVIQKTKIEGKLCLSIHPLDYMSISDNNMNWRSCHALDGEYRSGNLSYMIDSSTIVCYVKSYSDTQLERFPQGLLWNNKKWRVLLHVHDKSNIMYVNRQYPFASDELIRTVMGTAPIYNLGFGRASYYKDRGFRKINDLELEQNYFVLAGHIADPTKLCAGDTSSLQYNDFIFSPSYTPQFILPDKLMFYGPSSEDAIVSIGKRVPCPCGCGNYLEDSDSFICEKCRDQLDGIVSHCDDCGDEIYEDNGYCFNRETLMTLCRRCASALGITEGDGWTYIG